MNSTSITSIICDNIRNIRLSKGYKQVEMAKMLGIKQSSYNKIENNNIALTIETIEKIAMIFEMSIVDIIEFQKKRNPEKIFYLEKIERLFKELKSSNKELNSEHKSKIILQILQEYNTLLRDIEFK